MRSKILFVLFTLFLALVPLVNAANPGHSATAISPGTFAAGNYIFQNNLSVNERVGIGTATPDFTFHIIGSTSPMAVVQDTTDNVQAMIMADDYRSYYGSRTNHPMTLRTNNLDRLYIKSTGEIGINTTSPTHTLNVVGDTNITGNMYAGNNLVNQWLYNQTAPANAYTDTKLLTAGNSSFNQSLTNTLYVNKAGDTMTGNLIMNESNIQFNSGGVTVTCPSGMISYLKFDENTGSTAYDINGKNNATAGTPSWTTGKFGSAMHNTGANFFQITNPTFNFSKNISVAWYMKTTSPSGWFAWNLGSSCDYGTYFGYPGVGSMTLFSEGPTYSSLLNYSDGNWHYFVWERNVNGASTVLYIDGVPYTGGDTGSPCPASYMQVGGYWSGFNMIGDLDEFAVYNRTLSLSEILAQNSSSTGYCSSSGNPLNTGTLSHGQNGFSFDESLNMLNSNITNIGRLGIGTSVPTHTLNVVGDLNVTGTSYLGDVQISADNITTNGINAKSGDITFSNSSGTELFRITLAGKVGVGSSIPSTRLTVVPSADNINSGFSVRNTGDNQARAKISTVSDHGVLQLLDSGGNIGVQICAQAAAGNSYIKTNFTVDTTDNVLHVDVDNNRIGIGTASPTHKLTVAGDMNITGIGLISNLTSSDSIKYRNSSGAEVWRTYVNGSGALITEYVG